LYSRIFAHRYKTSKILEISQAAWESLGGLGGLQFRAETQESGWFARVTGKPSEGDPEIREGSLPQRRFIVDAALKSRHTAIAILEQTELPK